MISTFQLLYLYFFPLYLNFICLSNLCQEKIRRTNPPDSKIKFTENFFFVSFLSLLTLVSSPPLPELARLSKLAMQPRPYLLYFDVLRFLNLQ